MTQADVLLAILCALCCGVALYTYAIYPLVIWVLARCFGRDERRPFVADSELPGVSLLVVAHNEEAEIAARIENALAMDYPAGKLEIVIASDGSTDRTNEIVRRYAHRGVRLLAFEQQRGKSAALNRAIPQLSHPIVLLSDANTYAEPSACRRLAGWFSDPAVGVVCGRLVLTDPRTGRNVDGIYWKYETFLKKCESRLGALLGSNGGIYAIRKGLFTGIPANTIVDDFVIPLQARRQTGCRIIYDREAVACEETPAAIACEFHRRTRIGAGGFQSISLLKGLLHPRHGWVCFTFWSHKMLRWVCPFFLVGALLSSALLAGYGEFRALLVGQVAFYAGSILAGRLPARPRQLRWLKLGTMFTLMNAALLIGFLRWLRRGQEATWKRTERAARLPAPTVLPEVEMAGAHG
jgi:cellulose synthase/poly-beta-1,6-N-acetylglucosamine synthase-like glycosyltransferase